MAQTTYDYPFSDFGSALPVPPHKVDTDRLTLEIRQSAIVIALDGVTTANDICSIIFKDALSIGDVGILDIIVANHNGEPLPNDIPQPVEIYTGVAQPAPRTSDGRSIFLSSLFPSNVFFYINGSGDGPAVRGAGTQFNVSRSTNGDTAVEWSYLDWIYASGGGLYWQNAQVGDWADMLISAPASIVTPNGGGTGNCNLVPIPGGNLIVPAPGSGAYDVDLATAVPITAHTEEDTGVVGTGYWDWSTPNTGKGVITPSATPGQAFYNLLDFARPLVRFVNRFQIVGTDRANLTTPGIRPKRILPQWKLTVTLHNEAGGHDVVLQWYLMCARTTTV